MVALHPGHARLLPEKEIQRNIKGKRHFQGMTLETYNICAFNLISNQIKRWVCNVFQNVEGFYLFRQHSSTKNAFFHPQFWPHPSEYDEASPPHIFCRHFPFSPSSASSQTQSIPEHTGGDREERERERGYKGGRKRLSLVRPIDIAGGEKGEPSSFPPFQGATQKEGKDGWACLFLKKGRLCLSSKEDSCKGFDKETPWKKY